MTGRYLARVLFSTLFAIALSATFSAQSRPPDSDAPARERRVPRQVEGELLVKFRSGTPPSERAVAHGWARAQRLRTFSVVPNLEHVRLPKGMSVAEGLALYRGHPDVVYAEPNYIVETVQGAQTLPNDPQFGLQWGLHNTGQSGGTAAADIDAPDAWNITTGSSSVVVAVIDTGTDYTHPDLAANMFRNTADCNADGIDDDGNGFVDDCYGIDTLNNDSDPMDDNGHGTHTAGTIGAVGNNGIGVVGVNWNVQLMPCKFLGANGSGSTAGAIACLDYVKTMKDRGVNIVATSNSWGGGGYSQALYDAIDAQRQRGILFIAAAGNAGADNDSGGFYPANYSLPNIISVAATTRTDALASFSDYGRHTVHLGAPGQDILSTTPNNTYSSFSGTSMATPHVSGVAALLAAQDPSRDWRAIKNLILASGDTIPSLTNTITGRRLNAFNALTCSNSTVTSRLLPITTFVSATLNTPIRLAELNIDCALPNGPLTVTVDPGGSTITLVDDGTSGDQAAGDGIYSGTFTPTTVQTYTLTFPGGEIVTVGFPDSYFVTSAAYSYRAITGTNLNLFDDSVAAVTPPFPLQFGGVSLPTLYVGGNGVLSFSGPITDYFNVPLPDSFASTIVAPFWDDLYPNGSQNVYWDVIGAAPQRELVVEWRDVPTWSCPTGGTVKFQVVFFEGSSNILFNYADTVVGGGCAPADHGGSATVGIQVAPNRATQYSFNTAVLNDQTALLWAVQPVSTDPVLSVVPIAVDFGAVSVGGFVDRTFTVQNIGGGTLTGSATAAAPFSVVAGSTFSLGSLASQPLVVRFHPTIDGPANGTLTVASNTSSTAATLSGNGTLQFSGKVTNAATAAGLANVAVQIYDSTGAFRFSVGTDASGAYTAAPLSAGTYFARTSNSLGFIDTLYNGIVCPGSACSTTAGTPIPVAVGSTPANVDFALTTGGRIGGRVTSAATGAGLPNIEVDLYNASNQWLTWGLTNASGDYTTFGAVPTGTYYASTWNNGGYINKLFDDIVCAGCSPNSGAPIAVTAGFTTGNVNFAIDIGGRVGGKVTNASTGTALANVGVTVYNGSNQPAAYGYTDGSGNYLTYAGLPAGTYYARTFNSLGFVDELYNNIPCSSCSATSGTPISVPATGTVGNIDFALTSGGRISGRVTNAGSGAGLAGVSIWVFNSAGSFVTSALTDAAGNYAVSNGLNAGTYFVRTANSLGFADKVYNDIPCQSCNVTTGTPILVIAGATTPNIDFALTQGGRISGRITNAAGGAGLAGIEVDIYNASNQRMTYGFSDASGNYTTQGGIPAGTYYAQTWNSSGYVNKLFDNIVCLSCSPSSGTPITVVAGATATSINFVLSAGGRISGTVINGSTGAGLANVEIEIYNASNQFAGYGYTDASGNYTVYAGLPTGTYFARTRNFQGYPDILYNNIGCSPSCQPGTGTPIAVTAPSTSSHVDFALGAAGPIPSQNPNFGTFSIGLVQIPLSAIGGSGAYTWSVVGTLPPGMALRTDPTPYFPPDASAGLVGVATTPGTYTFTLRVASGGQTTDQACRIRITGLTVKDGNQFNNLPDAYAGAPYSYALTALNAAGPVTWSTTSPLPQGITLSPGGLLEGTPTADGSYFLYIRVSDGVDTTFRGLALRVNSLYIATDGVLPNATAGQPYSATLTVTGGTAPYTFSGFPPNGLTISPSSPSGVGTISGTVPQFSFVGPWGMFVTVTDSQNVSVTKYMSLDVIGAPPMLASLSSYGNFDDCTIGVVCSRGIAVRNGGTAPFAWTATGLPPGVSIRSGTGSPTAVISAAIGSAYTLQAGDGEIWGVPTAGGTFDVTVTVTDADNNTTTSVFPLHVSALDQPGVQPSPAINVPYSRNVRLVGGRSPYSGALFSGNLPAGLTFDPATQLLSGTPIENGSFNPVFVFTDADNETYRVTENLYVTGGGSGLSIFNGPDLGTVAAGSFFSIQLFACCAASANFSPIGALPPGLTLSSSGFLSGTAGADGTYTFLVSVTDASNTANFGQRQLTLHVVSGSVLTITSPYFLPRGTIGAPYLQTLTAAGGAGALTWSLRPFNHLPPGIALATDGTLSGTSAVSGQFMFAAEVRDAAGQVATSGFSLSVYPQTDPVRIDITSPAEPIYDRGSTLLAQFSCSNAATCIGDVTNGTALDTSVPGVHTFTVIATDAVGNTTFASVTYAISLGSCVAPLPGMTAWLPADGTAEDLITHTSALWTGTPAYAAGRVAQGFLVSPGNSVSLPLQQAGAFTLQAWLATPSPMLPAGTGIVSTGAAGQLATSFQMELDGFGNYGLTAGDGELSLFIGPARTVLDHVTVTFDGTMITTYLNGQLVDQQMWMGSPGLGFQTLTLGTARDGTQPFSGVIDEAVVFGRALTGGEVQQAFLAGSAGFCKNRAPVAVAVATPNPAEATSPQGATVTLDGTGSSDPDQDTLTYAWVEQTTPPTPLGSGSTRPVVFSVGSHVVTLTVDDGHGKSDSTTIAVVVQDTTAPVAQITSPSIDVLLSGPSVEIVAQASDVVGVDSVMINGVAATRTAGTAQAGTWRATVPITLPVPAGLALQFTAVALDAAGNPGAGSLAIDNDGIPSSLDRDRLTGTPQSGVYSNDFNNFVTAGTVTRNGWTAVLSNVGTAGTVRAQISGTGSIAKVRACVGATKEVRLDALGETADITCNPSTGTITVRALSAKPWIEVWKQQANNTWLVAQLPTGATYSTGSPATASADNTQPIDVRFVHLDDGGAATTVGGFRLAPGESVDVSVTPGMGGGADQVNVNVLRGRVAVTVSGRTRTLKPGERATLPVDVTPPR